MTTDVIKPEVVDDAGSGAMVRLGIINKLDPETLAKLMALQERYDANEAKKAFVKAMAGFKREAPPVIGKDRAADFGAGKAKYTYATTGAIVSAITPALSKNGLHLSWETAQEPNLVRVTCHITHDMGHRESATLTGPRDESGGKNPIQTIGSSVHYLQRYTMVSVLGLATADMDDADQTPPQARPPITPPKARSASAPPPAPPANADTPPPAEPPQEGGEPVGRRPIPSVEGAVARTAKKENKGKPGTFRYGIQIGEAWCNTFDVAVAEKAEKAKAADVPVRIQYAEGKFGNDVLTLTVLDAGAEQEPQEEKLF
jgi:hypothetical protein